MLEGRRPLIVAFLLGVLAMTAVTQVRLGLGCEGWARVAL